MRRIIAIAGAILLSLCLHAQSISDVEHLCKKAAEAAKNNQFNEALTNYDAAVAIITQNSRADLVVNIEGDLLDYIILGIAQSDKEKARGYAQQALGLRMECLAYYAKNGYFDNKEEYVDNIANEAINIGYTLADAGLLDDAENCFLAAIQAYPQTSVFTQTYPLTQEVMGNFYTKYKEDPGKGLEWQYDAFLSAVSLFEIDSDIAKQVFSRICTSYGIGLAYYSFAGNLGLASQYPEVPVYSYSQIACLVDSWDRIRADIVKKYGQEMYESLISLNPINTIGEERVRFGTPEHDVLFRALAAIHYHRMDDYEALEKQLLSLITVPEDQVAYSYCLVESLRNNRYVNYASGLYKTLHDCLVKESRPDLAMEQIDADASMMYYYGQYDYAWASVADIAWTVNDDTYVPEYPMLYVRQLILLSNLYDRFKNNLPAAEQAMIRALSIAQSDEYQIDKRILQTIFNNLSTIYNREEEHQKAHDAILKAVDCRREWAVENNCLDDFEHGIVWPALFYGNLADSYAELGDLPKAEILYRQCVDYYNTNYPHSEALLGIYDSLISLYDRQGDENRKLFYSQLSLDHLLNVYLFASQGMTKIQRTDYWHKLNTGISDVYAQFAIQNHSFAELAYDAALVDKGFLLRLEGIIQGNIRNSGDQNLISAYEQYKDAERRGLETKKQLEDRMMYLYSKHPEFNESVSFHHWQDVQSHLSKQDIAIEFATACSDGQHTTYAALLLKSGMKEPAVIKLDSGERFNKFLKDGAKAYRNNDELYSLIWKDIEPYLSGIKNIYFAPYGAISQLNIEVLENEKGKSINKLYNVFRLSSTGNLCEPKHSTVATSATLYGGLNYDTSVSELTASSRAYSGTVSDINTAIDFTSDQTRKGWKYLPGTEKEVQQIGTILDSKKIEHITFSQSQGTEESFKAMSGHSSPILHIATHGFYLDEKGAARSNPSLLAVEENDSHIYPMRRCGLILSGGQHAWLGESLPKDIEDGILTGEEIAGMDLSGTDLVVLSACQTGLGDIDREGVYGLQRGFKIAGAGTIIMSLWEVNDAATEIMMTKFYTQLASGKSKRDAFDSAISAVKSKFDGPEYWAAFIMLD